MKKVKFIILAAAATIVSSCGTQLLSSVGTLGSIANGQTIGNVIQSVIGTSALTHDNIVGTWNYSGPGCAFTSEQLLAKAGGEVAAAQIKEKMLPTYQSLGLSSANTLITFNKDNTFKAVIAGKSMSGQYTFDESTSKITLSGLLLNANCYAKRNADGIAVLFEASKLLTIMQTLSALSGNTTLTTIGDLSKNYDGLRMGFDMKK